MEPVEEKLAGINRTLHRNIEAFTARRRESEAQAGLSERISSRVTRIAGSMRFVLFHAVFFASWILVNTGVLPQLPRFDPSLVILAMMASVEAIFLSTFVLIAQNRMAAAADRRAELDLHISLLSENELTRLADLTARIAQKLGVEMADPEFHEVTTPVDPEMVLDELERREADN
jgi:uncharacterized membrane protein